jgi:hypothetical protein
MSMEPTGQQALLFALGQNALETSRNNRVDVHWSLQRHHPDGKRWLEVGRFPSKDLAEISRNALMAHGHGKKSEFRIKKVRIEPHA